MGIKRLTTQRQRNELKAKNQKKQDFKDAVNGATTLQQLKKVVLDLIKEVFKDKE